MAIIAHLLHFASEIDAFAALEGLEFQGWQGQTLQIVHQNGDTKTWDQSFVVANQTITTSPAVWDRTDPQNPVLVTQAVTLPGFWLTISLPTLSQDLIALPNNACRFCFDCDAQQFVYTAPDLNAALLQTAKIEPVFAGRTYPFNG